MKVTQNIGIVNALIRITVGFTVLSWATAKLVKKPWRDSYLWMALLGGMKVGEGILRFCPITAIFENQMDSDSGAKEGKSMLNIGSMLKGKKGENDSHQKIQDIDSDERKTDAPDLPYNPS